MDTSDGAGSGEAAMTTGQEATQLPKAGSSRTLSSSSYTSASSTVRDATTSISQQIRKIKNAAATPRIMGQHGTCKTTSYGSLIVSPETGPEDDR